MTVLSSDVKKLPRFAMLSLGMALIIYYIFHNLMGIFLPGGSIFLDKEGLACQQSSTAWD